MKKALILAILTLFYLNAVSQTGIPRAQAMFIYNFSRLIEWPSNYKSGPFVIGVLGTSSTYNELESFTNGKSVGSQPITVKRFNNTDEISTCHILFIPFASTKEMDVIIAALKTKSTLVITEKNGAINVGSAINFVIIGDKLKFEFKPDNVLKYGIKVSSTISEMAYKTY